MSIEVQKAIENGRANVATLTWSLDDYERWLNRMEMEAQLATEQARRANHERLRELARQQGVEPIQSISQLRGEFWPEEETMEEFLSWLREVRHDDAPRSMPE